MENNNYQFKIKVNDIVMSLLEKNSSNDKKRKLDDLKPSNWLSNQAACFLPEYQDFIIKIINNCEYKKTFNGSNDDEDARKEIMDNLIPFMNNDKGSKLDNGYISLENKQVKPLKIINNKINVNFLEPRNLSYELGHAVDYWFGQSKSLTNTLIVNDKTLYDIFNEEFKNKSEEICEKVLNEYKDIITNNINDKAYDILVEHIDSYRELKSIEIDLKDENVVKKRKEIQNKLDQCGFVECYYELIQLIMKKEFKPLEDKYRPILHALCNKYDFIGLNLVYLNKKDPKKPKELSKCSVQEFFADLFEAKVASNQPYYDELRKLLPESFAGFEELFKISNEHIIKDKKFDDVKVKKGTKYYE